MAFGVRDESRSCDKKRYGRMAHIIVRHGTALAHARSAREAAEIMLALTSLRQSEITGETASTNESNSILASAVIAANKALSLIPQVVDVQLQGRARKNLGTALRVRNVRTALHELRTEAGDALLTELEYIANAADASRHLSHNSIDCAMATLNATADRADRMCASRSSAASRNGELTWNGDFVTSESGDCVDVTTADEFYKISVVEASTQTCALLNDGAGVANQMCGIHTPTCEPYDSSGVALVGEPLLDRNTGVLTPGTNSEMQSREYPHSIEQMQPLVLDKEYVLPANGGNSTVHGSGTHIGTPSTTATSSCSFLMSPEMKTPSLREQPTPTSLWPMFSPLLGPAPKSVISPAALYEDSMGSTIDSHLSTVAGMLASIQHDRACDPYWSSST